MLRICYGILTIVYPVVKMFNQSFHELKVYQLSEKLANEIWQIVQGWNTFTKNTIGTELVRAADSIGANIAAGLGRGIYEDNYRLVNVAKSSLHQTQHWLKIAHKRQLLTTEQQHTLKMVINQLARELQLYSKLLSKAYNQTNN